MFTVRATKLQNGDKGHKISTAQVSDRSDHCWLTVSLLNASVMAENDRNKQVCRFYISSQLKLIASCLPESHCNCPCKVMVMAKQEDKDHAKIGVNLGLAFTWTFVGDTVHKQWLTVPAQYTSNYQDALWSHWEHEIQTLVPWIFLWCFARSCWICFRAWWPLSYPCPRRSGWTLWRWCQRMSHLQSLLLPHS